MGDVDDFFNRKQKKKHLKKNPKKYVAATDIFSKEDEFSGVGENPNEPKQVRERKNHYFNGHSPSLWIDFFTIKADKEDEWIEQTGEQEFVIESVGGIKRLELEERVSNYIFGYFSAVC